MNAFNYETQTWVTGPEAQKLIVEQIQTDLSLLEGKDGERYAKFTGVNRLQTIAKLKASLADVMSIKV